MNKQEGCRLAPEVGFSTVSLRESMKAAFWLLLFVAPSCMAGQWYLGQWRVTGAEFSGISAIGSEDAERWVGEIATYSQNKASFHGAICESPDYKASSLSEKEFLERFRVPLSSIKPGSKQIRIVEVKCPDNWTAPGAYALKKSNNEIYILWDGAFFVLERKSLNKAKQ